VSVDRLITLAVERDTPLDVLAHLRAIEPTVELLCVGNGKWWLGLVKPNPSQHNATAPLGQTPWTTTREIKVQLQRQGFRFLAEYDDEQVTSAYLGEELNYMLNRTEKEVEAGFWAAVDKSDYSLQHEQAITQAIMGKVTSESRSIWAKAARDRKLVAVNGLRGH
jgi:hypothetical protein